MRVRKRFGTTGSVMQPMVFGRPAPVWAAAHAISQARQPEHLVKSALTKPVVVVVIVLLF
jgi:hypothetical protein